jgi:glycosyltransferase involved in cell wall biosynthesis
VLPSFAGGGAERVMLTVAAKLDRARFAPIVLVLDDKGPWRALLAGDEQVAILGKPRLRQALPRLPWALRSLKAAAAISTIGYLNLGLLSLKPLLPRRMRLIVREANTPRRNGAGAMSRAAYRLAYRRLYRRADAVIVPADYLAEELAGEFGVPREPIRVIPNPVDVAALRQVAALPRREPGPGRRFVAAGRLTSQKAFDRAIAAMRALAPADRLTIFGEGPLREELAAQAAAPGVAERVHLAGFDAEAAAWYAGADALLLPSRWEGLPNVALEALAVGTRVIATPEAGGIAGIAAQAPPGAVSLCRWPGEFGAAMAAATPAPPAALRDSLLPPAFALDAVLAQYAAILEGRAP